MRVAIYARYSTDLQNPASIDDQVRVCSDYARKNNYEIVNYFTDAAVSGSSLNRTGIQSLLQSAPLFDAVLCEAMDRLSRDQADIANIHKHLSYENVKIITLADGEINLMHVGLKGTMNALFLKDLADKTHRGLSGRIQKGKSGGGNSYGYRVVRDLDHHGELIKGDREVDSDQSAVVDHIFKRFALFNESPKKIAADLNKKGVTAPTGGEWGSSTIQGNRRRGTGILNNELYIGRLVWNRLKYTKHPVSGKRISRLNPESEWIVKDVPELQIIDTELWEAAKRKQKRLTTIDGNAKPVMRPIHPLSHLIVCDCCGGGFSLINKGRYGCSRSRNKGTCDNRVSIKKDLLESAVINYLKDELIKPDVIDAFIQEYNRHLKTLNQSNVKNAKSNQKKVTELQKQKANIIDSIKKGIPVEYVKEELTKIENSLQSYNKVVDLPKVKKVFPVGTAKRYTDMVESLHSGSFGVEALEFMRGLISKVVVYNVDGKADADLHIDMMGLVPEMSRPTVKGRSNLLVAGAGLTEVLPVHIASVTRYAS